MHAKIPFRFLHDEGLFCGYLYCKTAPAIEATLGYALTSSPPLQTFPTAKFKRGQTDNDILRGREAEMEAEAETGYLPNNGPGSLVLIQAEHRAVPTPLHRRANRQSQASSRKVSVALKESEEKFSWLSKV